MTLEEARERVSRGAALLDEKRPGWAFLVNPNELRMAECQACVLGQLYQEFVTGAFTLNLYSKLFQMFDDIPLNEQERAVRHGFLVANSYCEESYDELRAVWLEEIAKRTDAPVVTWTPRDRVPVGQV